MSWSREYLKENAKQVLKWSYWNALAVCFLAALLGGSGVSGSSTSANLTYSEDMTAEDPEIVMIFLVIAAVMMLLSAAFRVFVGNPVQVGKHRFFIANRQQKGAIGQLFSLFKQGRYLNVVKVMFLRDLYISLWSLLCIIPGVIKGYEYRMIPYLLAENPNLDAERAFQISRAMTDGEKLDMWVLDLSFIGWELLGVLACCIGTYFVLPYEEATWAELYAVLKYKGISMGAAHPDELGGQEGYTGEPTPPPYPGAYSAPGQYQYPQGGWYGQTGYGQNAWGTPPAPPVPPYGAAPQGGQAGAGQGQDVQPPSVPEEPEPPCTAQEQAPQDGAEPAPEAGLQPERNSAAPVYEKPVYEKPVYEKPSEAGDTAEEEPGREEEAGGESDEKDTGPEE